MSPTGKIVVVSLATNAVVLMVIASVMWMHNNRQRQARNACVNNLRQIEAAMESTALERRYVNGEEVPLEFFTRYIKGLSLPKCPSGGFYTVRPVGTTPLCSCHGDALLKTYLELLRSQPHKSLGLDNNGMPTVDLNGCSVIDLGIYQGCSGISLENTAVDSLDPLRPKHKGEGWNLRYLNITGSKVTDLAPLTRQPLIEFRFTHGNITNGLDIMRQMKTLKRINGMPAEKFWTEYDGK